MLDVLLSILALVGCGFTLEAFAASFPSVGLGEKRRFCLETDPLPMSEDIQAGNPS